MRSLKTEVMQSSVEGLCIEEELKESGEKIQALLNLLPDPVVIVDGKGKFLAVNDRVEEKTGFRREELLGKNFLRTKIVTAKSKAILMKKLVKRMIRLHVAPYEVEVLTKDCKKLTVEINATKIEYEGKPADLVVFRDITERRKAEEEVRKLNSALTQSIDGIAIGDLEPKLTYVNDAFARMHGYSAKELIGQKVAILHNNEQMEEFGKGIHKIKTQGLWKGEIGHIRKDGTPFSTYMSVTLLKDEKGKPAGILAVCRDITERKKAEQEIRIKDNAIASSMNAIALADLEGNLTYINRSFLKLWEYNNDEEVLGKPAVKFWRSEEKAANVVKALRNKGSWMGELTATKRDGSTFDVQLLASMVNDEVGKPICMMASFIDITERKQMEEKLRKYTEHLEELVEERTRELRESQERLLKSERLAAIGELATMVGHDLRNPLQSVENATYYLNNELPRILPSILISQKAMEMLQIINDSVNYADKIIKDLHDFSATKKPTLKKTNINAIVKEALSQVETPENVKLITELGHLPRIEADKDMIKRAFLNLAINGMQAMEEKGGRLKVSSKKTKGFVEVSFEDTGAGMPKENIEKIFTPFFTTRAKGIGMGLPIYKKFVDAHGGSIEVESKKGKGSTFTVKLPIQRKNGGEKLDER